MTYYTIRVTNALAGRFVVARNPRCVNSSPTFLYPGRSHVGSATTRLDYDPAVKVLGWRRLVLDAEPFPGPERPKEVETGRRHLRMVDWDSRPTYLAIALLARLRGAPVIVEIHEVLGGGEERIPIARAFVSSTWSGPSSDSHRPL